MEEVFDEAFLQRQNNRVCEFPVIAGRQLEDIVREKMGTENFHANLSYFSWLDYDSEIGIIEEVYGAKLKRVLEFNGIVNLCHGCYGVNQSKSNWTN